MKVLLARQTPDGTHILMGKTFVLGEELVFCHESRRESWYRDLNSPYGVDCDVLNWLYSMQVSQVHHYVRESNRLYVASVSDILAYGIHHDLPDGPRLYLPAPKWEVMCGRAYRCPWIQNVKEFPWVGDAVMAAGLTEADTDSDDAQLLNVDDLVISEAELVIGGAPAVACAEKRHIPGSTVSGGSETLIRTGLTARLSEIGRIKQPQKRHSKKGFANRPLTPSPMVGANQ